MFFKLYFVVFKNRIDAAMAGICVVCNIRCVLYVQDSDWLSLGTGSVSWWESNGPGCKPQFLANLSTLEVLPWLPLRPDSVSGCLILYHYLEAAQAVFHLILGVILTVLEYSLSLLHTTRLLPDPDETVRREEQRSLVEGCKFCSSQTSDRMWKVLSGTKGRRSGRRTLGISFSLL